MRNTSFNRFSIYFALLQLIIIISVGSIEPTEIMISCLSYPLPRAVYFFV